MKKHLEYKDEKIHKFWQIDMFGHYNIKFKDTSEFKLHGSDFFGDRIEFSRHHNENLLHFSLEVCNKGRPARLYTSYEDKILTFNSDTEFDEWYLKNQSRNLDFGFSDVKTIEELNIEVNKRIEVIKTIFIEDLEDLQSGELYFRYYYERYNRLLKEVKISLKSIDVLLSKHQFDEEKLKKFHLLFQSPLLEIEGKKSLAFYNKTTEKTISKKEMIQLIKTHYSLFIKKIF